MSQDLWGKTRYVYKLLRACNCSTVPWLMFSWSWCRRVLPPPTYPPYYLVTVTNVQLILVLPGALSSHISTVIPGIQFSLSEKQTSSNMKIDTLAFIQVTNRSLVLGPQFFILLLLYFFTKPVRFTFDSKILINISLWNQVQIPVLQLEKSSVLYGNSSALVLTRRFHAVLLFSLRAVLIIHFPLQISSYSR